jgi:hypothetical protein
MHAVIAVTIQPCSGASQSYTCSSRRVVRGGVEPPTFRFSGAYAASLYVPGCGLMGQLAAKTTARCRLMWPDICRCWLPVRLPNLVSAANVR